MPLWKAPSMVWPCDTSLGHSCESKSGRILGIAELYKCETWCDWLQVSNHLTICSSMWIIIPNRWNRKSLKPAARKVERGQWFIVVGKRKLLVGPCPNIIGISHAHKYGIYTVPVPKMPGTNPCPSGCLGWVQHIVPLLYHWDFFIPLET